MRLKISNADYRELEMIKNIMQKTEEGIYDGFCKSDKCIRGLCGCKRRLILTTNKRYARPQVCPNCRSILVWIKR